MISLFDIFRILANDAVKIPGAPSTARGWQIVRSFSDSQAADAARYFRTANIIGTATIERTVHYWQSYKSVGALRKADREKGAQGIEPRRV